MNPPVTFWVFQFITIRGDRVEMKTTFLSRFSLCSKRVRVENLYFYVSFRVNCNCCKSKSQWFIIYIKKSHHIEISSGLGNKTVLESFRDRMIVLMCKVRDGRNILAGKFGTITAPMSNEDKCLCCLFLFSFLCSPLRAQADMSQCLFLSSRRLSLGEESGEILNILLRPYAWDVGALGMWGGKRPWDVKSCTCRWEYCEEGRCAHERLQPSGDYSKKNSHVCQEMEKQWLMLLLLCSGRFYQQVSQ